MRLRYEPDFGYVLRYTPRDSRGTDIVRILPGGVYQVSDGGFAAQTSVKKLSGFSPVGNLKPYLRGGRIYFGSPKGRYGMGSEDWLTLTPNKWTWTVSGAASPDPVETPRWTQALIERYAMLVRDWVAENGRLPQGDVDTLTPSEVAEYVLTETPNLSILWAAITRGVSTRALPQKIDRIDKGDVTIVADDVLKLLRSIKKDLEPIITQSIVESA